MDTAQMAFRMIPTFNEKLEGHLLYEESISCKQAFGKMCLAVKKKEDKFNWLMALGERFINRIYENFKKKKSCC
jgi:hypothetical protein